MSRSFRFAPRVALRGVTLWLLPLLASCGGGGGADAPPAPPPAPVPASIRLSQSGPIALIAGQSASLTATVVDASGQPLPSAVVNWTSSSPTIVGVGGSGSSTTLSAIGQVGSASVQASSGAVTSAAVVVNVGAAAASRLTVTANGTQTRAAGDTTLPLLLRVTDQFNNPVPGATITWSTTGGTLVSATSASIADGTTSNRLTLGSVAGSFVVTAALTGATPVTFSIRVTAGTAAQIAVGTALPASLVVGSTAPITAIITDRFGNRVAGVPVAFTATTGTATVTPAAAISDENGIAAASVTLGRLSGPQAIQAAVSGLTGSPLAFSTTALPGPATSLVRVSADPAPAPAGAALGDSMRVRVVDANGNGVAGVAVVFSISGGGGSVSPAIASSAADGSAATRWVSGPTAAVNTLVASSGVLTPVSFSATTTVPIGPPAVVSLASPRLVFLDSGATTTLAATARDANGVTVPNPAIQFTARNGSVIGTAGNVLTALRRGQSIVTASAGSATPDSVLAVVLGANGITLQTDLTRFDIRPDETFTVPVLVDLRAATERLGSAAITVTFDPTQIAFVSRAAGASGVNSTVNDAQSATGRITLTFADATGFGGRVELLRLTFRATSSTGRTGSLTLSATELNSTTFADLTGRLTAITYPLVIR